MGTFGSYFNASEFIDETQKKTGKKIVRERAGDAHPAKPGLIKKPDYDLLAGIFGSETFDADELVRMINLYSVTAVRNAEEFAEKFKATVGQASKNVEY